MEGWCYRRSCGEVVDHDGKRRRHHRVCVALLLAWMALAPRGAEGQLVSAVIGRPPERSRVIGALLAMHPFETQFPEVEWTGGVGVQVGQWFGATFTNSYDERSFIAGLVRHWYSARYRRLETGVGYRMGLVTGYDERLFDLAGRVPAVPFVGFLAYLDIRPLTVDVFYVYRAIAIEGGVRF